MYSKIDEQFENALEPAESSGMFPACHLVSLNGILDAPDFPLPPFCTCDHKIKFPPFCGTKKTCTADCGCDIHICTCDPVCPCLAKCHHCYCDNKFGRSPIDSGAVVGCEAHARTLFRIAK